MIEVSSTFKEAARAPVKVIRASIVCENDTYTSSDVLVSLSKEDTGFYFSTTTKSLSFKLLGTDYDLVGKNVTATYEIQSGNSWDGCILGRFAIYEQTVNLEKGTTEFKAYDGRYFSTPKKMGAQTAEANTNAGIAAAKQINAYFSEGCTKFQVNK